MTIDFSLILFLLVCITGSIWLLDRLVLSRKRVQGQGVEGSSPHKAKEPLYVEYARAFFPVILIVFVLRSFIVEPFRIPSGSMLPSLHVGDFILVNKFAYGLRLPVVNKKVVSLGEPQRGDVLVFRFPDDPSINYIKRVVGLPGDRVVYDGKRLYVNGRLMAQTPIDSYTVRQQGEPLYTANRNMESLDGVEHHILLSPRVDLSVIEREVPVGKYFVMGDNRDHSNDSRYWGFVPEENLVGKAFLIWFSWDSSRRHDWFWQQIAFDRIGNTIH